jgi:hypothetical protein
VEFPPEWRPSVKYMSSIVKIALKLPLIFSGRKIVSTIIIRFRETFWWHAQKSGVAGGPKIISGNGRAMA